VKLRRTLDHDRLDIRLPERDRRRETADPRSDDNRTHASSLRRTTRGDTAVRLRLPAGSSAGERFGSH
jgi:hypothetical protein